VSRDVNFVENSTSRSTHASSTVIEEKEKQALKDEKQSTVQTLGGE